MNKILKKYIRLIEISHSIIHGFLRVLKIAKGREFESFCSQIHIFASFAFFGDHFTRLQWKPRERLRNARNISAYGS